MEDQAMNPTDYQRSLEQRGVSFVDTRYRNSDIDTSRQAAKTAGAFTEISTHGHYRHGVDDLKLHGFGLKTTALAHPLVRSLLHTADSMAWSFAARILGRNGNDYREAIRWSENITTRPVQHVFPFHLG
jgi:hypothetical protein